MTNFGKGSRPLAQAAGSPDVWIVAADNSDGFKIMTAVKKLDETKPVILTSAKEGLIDRVLGLELGCDDFLLKPLSLRELVLRIRRLTGNVCLEAGMPELTLQEYQLEPRRRAAICPDTTIALTSKEFELLRLFCRHKGQVLSRDQILQCVWGGNYSGQPRVVDDLIRRMRRKMTDLKIETIYGYGYRIS